jgi:superfamily II DNA or RNA helicase
MSKTILCKEGYLIPKDAKNTKIIENVRKELTVSPFQVMNYGFKKAPKFPVYQENEEYICVPKYYGMEKFGKPSINKEIPGQKINIKFKGTLREPQNIILNSIIPHLEKNDGGVLVLPCASGKTVLSLYLAAKFQVKTLVIVHKTFLLEQWKERAEQFTDAKVGILQQKKIQVDGYDIVIGMLQSIAKDKYDSELFRDFGMVIFDEAHHAPSKYFSQALPIIASKITIGLSATPKRQDQLEKVLYWYFGSIMYKTISDKNDRVLVNVFNYDLQHPKFQEYCLPTGDINRPKTINKLTSIGRRNKFIIDQLEEVLLEANRKVLILSDRVEHLKLLKLRLDKRELTTSDFYIGGMKQEKLKVAEEAQVIFATYGMAAEALDIPDLNALFMVTPRREVEQAVGRVIRKINPDLRPVIYDFVDQLSSFINQGYSRRTFYRRKGFEVKLFQVDNNKIINENDISEVININEFSSKEGIDFIDD